LKIHSEAEECSYCCSCSWRLRLHQCTPTVQGAGGRREAHRRRRYDTMPMRCASRVMQIGRIMAQKLCSAQDARLNTVMPPPSSTKDQNIARRLSPADFISATTTTKRLYVHFGTSSGQNFNELIDHTTSVSCASKTSFPRLYRLLAPTDAPGFQSNQTNDNSDLRKPYL
jgi:hypothetical protein